jgi:DNA-3-methyladenine glycosylase II
MARAPVLTFPAAQRQLSRRDPALRKLIRAIGPCTLQPEPNCLLVLTRAIISQLISTRAADTVFTRLHTALGGNGVTAEALLALGEDGIRSAGLSRNKCRALLELATRTSDGRLPFEGLHGLTDREVLDLILPVPGIGEWTGHMFLIFGLGRFDVLPTGDLGLRAAMRDLDGREELPTRAEVLARAEVWKPYRTVATWYLWRSRHVVPQPD